MDGVGPSDARGARLRSALDCSLGNQILKADLYMQAVEAIYASGAKASLVPEALAATSRLIGARGATFEVIDKAARRPVEIASAGLPVVARSQYFEHFSALNPRIPPALVQRPGELSWDYKLFDERAMARDPFTPNSFQRLGLRYFISAVLEQTPDRTRGRDRPAREATGARRKSRDVPDAPPFSPFSKSP